MNVIGQIRDPIMMGRTLVGNVVCQLRLRSIFLRRTDLSFGKYLKKFLLVLRLRLPLEETLLASS